MNTRPLRTPISARGNGTVRNATDRSDSWNVEERSEQSQGRQVPGEFPEGIEPFERCAIWHFNVHGAVEICFRNFFSKRLFAFCITEINRLNAAENIEEQYDKDTTTTECADAIVEHNN